MTEEPVGGESRAAAPQGGLAWEGFVAGLIGYATIVVLYAVGNLVGGEWILHTPTVLGSAILGDAVPDPVSAAGPAPIFVYNGLHLLAFLGVGFGSAWLVREIEMHPVEWYLAFFAFVMAFMFSLVVVYAVAVPVLEAFPTGSVLWANLAAAGAVGFYLARRHRGLLERVSREGDPEAE